MTLRQRGAQFTGLGNANGPTGKLVHEPASGNLSSCLTVWSMPGGFTSGGREGYQNIDEDAPFERPRAPARPSPNRPPSSTPPYAHPQPPPVQQPPAAVAAAPAPYQSV